MKTLQMALFASACMIAMSSPSVMNMTDGSDDTNSGGGSGPDTTADTVTDTTTLATGDVGNASDTIGDDNDDDDLDGDEDEDEDD